MMANTALQSLNSLGYFSETVNHFGSSDCPRHIKNHLSPKELACIQKRQTKRVNQACISPAPHSLFPPSSTITMNQHHGYFIFN